MSKNTSFSIGEHFSAFAETQLGQGRYSSASDVVRAALVEGEQSGISDRNVSEIWDAVKAKAKARATTV